MSDLVGDYFSGLVNSETAAADAEGLAGMGSPPLAPLVQGASFGLAGNLGLLPSNYAKQRAANPLAYKALEDLGMLGSSTALFPEISLPADMGRLAAFGARAGYNALAGGALGAASTNVSGGDVGENAAGGAISAATLAPLASIASIVAPKVSANVAKYLDAYSSMFGSSSGKTVDEMGKEVSGMFQNFVNDAGGIDMLTTVPANDRYPDQTLMARLASIKKANYRGAGKTGDDVGAVVDNLFDEANSNSGIINPAAYTRFTQRGGDVANLARSPHGLGRTAGGDIREALDDALAMQSSGLEQRFNAASKNHSDAMDELNQASNALTLAQSMHLPTNNVYGTSAGNSAIASAQQALNNAQEVVQRTGAAKDAIVARLKGAQADESIGESPDLNQINAARDAYKLWRIADAYQSGGKQSAAKLSRLVDKHFASGGDLPAPTTNDLTQAAMNQPHGLLSRAKDAGMLIGGADLLSEHVINPLIAHMGVPSLLSGGLGLAGAAGGTLAANAARRTLLAPAGLARALGKANPLLLHQPSGLVNAAAIGGASVMPGSAPSSSDDSVLNYFQSLR